MEHIIERKVKEKKNEQSNLKSGYKV